MVCSQEAREAERKPKMLAKWPSRILQTGAPERAELLTKPLAKVPEVHGYVKLQVGQKKYIYIHTDGRENTYGNRGLNGRLWASNGIRNLLDR
jgi:hypothetical protein